MGWDLTNFTTIHTHSLSFLPVSVHPLKYSPRSEKTKQRVFEKKRKEERRERIKKGLEEESEESEEDEKCSKRRKDKKEEKQEEERKEQEKEEKQKNNNIGDKKDHLMVGGIHRKIQILDLESGVCVDKLEGHENSVYSFKVLITLLLTIFIYCILLFCLVISNFVSDFPRQNSSISISRL